MRKKVKGQITVYAALSVMLVMVFVITGMKSAILSAAKADADAAGQLAMEAAFSGYDNELLERYDIFAIQDSGEADHKIPVYIRKNLEGGAHIQLLSAEVESKTHMTDREGRCLRDQVLSYMKYGAGSELLQEITGKQKELEDYEKTSQIADSMAKSEEAVFEKNEVVMQILSLVEGVRTTADGLVLQEGKPVATEEGFVKEILNGEESMETAEVPNGQVYEAVRRGKTGYCNAAAILRQRREQNGKQDMQSVQQLLALQKAVQESLDAARKAEVLLTGLEQKKSTEGESLRTCRQQLETGKEQVGEEVYTQLSQDLEKMENTQSTKYQLCDTGQLQGALQRQTDVLERLQMELGTLQEKSTEQGSDQTDQIAACEHLLQQLQNQSLQFDYSGMTFSSEKKGLQEIRKLYQSLSGGVAGLVLEGKTISDQSAAVADLASSGDSGDRDEESGISVLDKGKEEMLFQEYLFTHFSSYMDWQQQEQKNTAKPLSYELEYILQGEQSDKANLDKTILQMSLYRCGVNLTCLILDSERREEAFALSAELLGFTGNAAVIIAGEYLILTVWAYAETLGELRSLCNGKKIELIKTRQNWKLSLEGALKGELDRQEEGKGGLDYEGFERILFLCQKPSKKYFRTMDVMELFMIGGGRKDFRMRDHLAALSCRIRYELPYTGNVVERSMKYGYIW